MTLRARKCKGCKALPSDIKKGECKLGRGFFYTDEGIPVPLGVSCSEKAITFEILNYKLSLKK